MQIYFFKMNKKATRLFSTYYNMLWIIPLPLGTGVSWPPH